MANIDFTPVHDLLGREVCFRDLAFESSFKEYATSFEDIDFKAQVYLTVLNLVV